MVLAHVVPVEGEPPVAGPWGGGPGIGLAQRLYGKSLHEGTLRAWGDRTAVPATISARSSPALASGSASEATITEQLPRNGGGQDRVTELRPGWATISLFAAPESGGPTGSNQQQRH